MLFISKNKELTACVITSINKQKKELNATGDIAVHIASRTQNENAIETITKEIERLKLQSTEAREKKEIISKFDIIKLIMFV